MPDPESPQFHVSNEGEPIPEVDPQDLRCVWSIKPGDKEAWIAASQEANSAAVSKRCWMIRALTAFNKGQPLLAPWKHGEELDDAVFLVAATFPIRPLRQHIYMVPGDLRLGFDPNAFVEKLIEETGIPHVWEPVPARISEGNWSYSIIRAGSGSATDSDGEVRHRISELLWAVWSKCHPKLSRPSPNHTEYDVQVIAMRFAQFVIASVDLARECVSWNGAGRSRLAILADLEGRALSLFHRP